MHIDISMVVWIHFSVYTSFQKSLPFLIVRSNNVVCDYLLLLNTRRRCRPGFPPDARSF